MKQTVVFFFVLLLYSCNNREKTENITIDLKNVSSTISTNELFDSIEYIPLEITEKSIFKAINKMEFYENQFFILDKTGMKKIYVFNQDGSFNYTIGNTGNGPGEYTNVEDFTIDKEKRQLILLTYPSSVVVYDLNGEYLYTKKIGESLYWNICSYKSGYVCATNHQTYTEGENAFLLFIFDKDFQLIAKLLPVLPDQVAIPPFISNPLYENGEDIVYFDNFTANIYFLPVENPAKMKSIHFDLPSPPPSKVFNDPQLFFNKQGEYSFFTEAFCVNQTLWASFSHKGSLCVSVVDFQNGKKKIAQMDSWFPKILFYKDPYLYSYVNSEWVLDDEMELFSAANFAKHPIVEDSNQLIVRLRPVYK
jgi:hypothetical protein